MRLRDVGVLGGAFMVLCMFSGCNSLHKSQTYQPQHDNTHFKSDPVTKHSKAMNEVALAQEYMEQGQNDVALDDLQKAIKLDSSTPEAYTLLGVLNERLNRLDQAGAAYEKSAKLAPNNGNILNNYGAWLCRSGHPAEADEQFRKALADPFYKTPTMALANAASCAYQAGKPAQAEGYDRQILAVEPNNATALQTMAEIDFQRGEFMQARGFIERVLGAGKVAPESLDLAMHIEEKLGDQTSASAYRVRLSNEFPQYTLRQF